MNIIKNSLLSLAAVGAFALAGAAQASGGVIYQGTTTLYNPNLGTSVSCTLQIAGTIDSSGNVSVDAAGVLSGSNCQYVYTGMFPWTGTISGSTLSTGTDSTVIYLPGFGVAGTCGGTISGISYGSGSPPASVTINSGGSANYGNCTLDGTLTLDP